MAGVSAIGLLGAVVWAAWIGDLHDFDTDELILLATTGQAPRADNAHAWSVFHHAAFALCDALGSALVGWRVAVVMGIVATASLLAWLGRRSAGNQAAAVLAPCLYLASPCTWDLARRTEENIGYHPMFVAVAAMLVAGWDLRGAGVGRAAALVAAASALAVTHLQPFLILAGAVGLLAVARIARRERVEALRAVGFVIAAPALVLAAAIWLGGSAWVRYEQQYLSIFSAPDLAEYLGTYLGAGIAFGVYPIEAFRYEEGHVVHAASATVMVVAGMAWIGILVWSLERPRAMTALLFASLVFVGLYEPTSSERWDCVTLSLCLFVAMEARRVGRILATVLLVLHLSAVPQACRHVDLAAESAASSFAELEPSACVYFEWSEVRPLVRQLPVGTRLRPIEGSRPTPGSFVCAGQEMLRRLRDRGTTLRPGGPKLLVVGP